MQRVGIQSPNLRPKADHKTAQITKPLVKIRIFVFAHATVYATSLSPNGFQLPFASTVRIEPDIMLGARAQTVACLTNAVQEHPGGFPFTSR